MLIGVGLAACASRPGAAQDPEAPTAPSEEVVPAVSLSSLFVSPAQAATTSEAGALLLDARPSHLFFLSHAAGAIHIRWDDFSDPDERGLLHPNASVLAEQLSALGVTDGRAALVIGGWDAQWGEEARIAWMLRHLGLNEVAVVEGGHRAWSDAGLATESGRSRPTPGSFTPTPVPALTAELSDLDEFVLVLDVRTREEFDGATLHDEHRGGHVPGARHLHWTELLADDGTVLSPSAVRDLVGVGVDVPVVAYCTGGVRSAFAWAVLEHAGYTHAANYAGSWWEYAASDLPVE
jgi:thiosulfate/3-mercaptopyruvate sulfurtransferase